MGISCIGRACQRGEQIGDRAKFTLDEAIVVMLMMMMTCSSTHDPRAQDLVESCSLRVARCACSKLLDVGAKLEEGRAVWGRRPEGKEKEVSGVQMSIGENE